MKKLAILLGEDEGVLGPGTDLAISLVAVLLLIIAIKCRIDERDYQTRLRLEANLRAQIAIIEKERKLQHRNIDRERQGQIEIREVLENQARFVAALADRCGTSYKTVGPNVYAVTLPARTEEKSPDIVIQNDATLQRISFGGEILFKGDEVNLLPKGLTILRALSDVLLSQSRPERVLEIQIQGHADPVPSQRYPSNLELAAHRAMTVFQALQILGIDPRYEMMSATTFGEYVPVQRRSHGISYSPDQLAEDNNSSTKRMMNRRIEILLIYRRLSS